MAHLELGCLASGEGTTLQTVIDACKSGVLDADVRVVISNNSKSGALRRAAEYGVPGFHLSSATHPDPQALDEAIRDALDRHNVSLVLLAGYMKKLGPCTRAKFAGRVLNTHPALLPKFGGQGMYGRAVHEAVLSAGDKVTGVTIHLADDEYDHGPTVAQCELPVLDDDTTGSLSERVQNREREFLVDTLRQISLGEIELPALG